MSSNRCCCADFQRYQAPEAHGGICTALLSWITHVHLVPLSVTKRSPVHFILNRVWARHINGLKIVPTRAGFDPTISRLRLYVAALFCSLLRQNAIYRGLSVKHGLGYLGHRQTVQPQIRHRRPRCLIRVCSVCFNNRKLRGEWNNLKSPFRTIFSDYTQRQNTHQCCQCFDCFSI